MKPLAAAPAPLWLPEDELRLKNALEAGASLESLAKGGVRFSREYSVAELQDRWCFILYDVEGSAKAAASMLNLELGKFTGAGTRAGNGGAKRKREIESIRKRYYAMQRKRKNIRRKIVPRSVALKSPSIAKVEIDVSASADVYEHPEAEDHVASKNLEEKSLPCSPEGGDDNDDGDNDEEELPNFYDVENMVLQMDLCLVDQDTNACAEVLEYQHEELARTIMRLEQCARSVMQRAIASKGALAVLYGLKMKKYIMKSEVILGRATDGVQVDIDLGTEGLANRISRRQALIKMEANGSFIIKNLGQSSIFLNGKEVSKGQLCGLSASCFIEISGLFFIFEFNNMSMRRFLENEVPKRER